MSDFQDFTRPASLPIHPAAPPAPAAPPQCPNPDCDRGRIRGTSIGCAVCCGGTRDAPAADAPSEADDYDANELCHCGVSRAEHGTAHPFHPPIPDNPVKRARTLSVELERLRAHVATLDARLKDAERDTARLDWLQEHAAEVTPLFSCDPEEPGWRVHSEESLDMGEGFTLREAIDFASRTALSPPPTDG